MDQRLRKLVQAGGSGSDGDQARVSANRPGHIIGSGLESPAEEPPQNAVLLSFTGLRRSRVGRNQAACWPIERNWFLCDSTNPTGR